MRRTARCRRSWGAAPALLFPSAFPRRPIRARRPRVASPRDRGPPPRPDRPRRGGGPRPRPRLRLHRGHPRPPRGHHRRPARRRRGQGARPGTDPAALALRLAVAARLPGILLPPLAPAPAELHGRPVTYWPYGTPWTRTTRTPPPGRRRAPSSPACTGSRSPRPSLPCADPRRPPRPSRSSGTSPRATRPRAPCWTPGRTSRRGPAARRPRRDPYASATATSTSAS